MHCGLRTARHNGLRERCNINRHLMPVRFSLTKHTPKQLQKEKMDVPHLSSSGVGSNPIGADPLTNFERARAQPIRYALPRAIMRLRARAVTFGADSNRRFQNLPV